MSLLRPLPPSPPSASASRGFSMVEVLVAIVILSIGVLGAVGLQATAMRSNREVRSQAIAGSLARDLAEKMRGNHVVAIQPTTAANPYLLDETLTPGTTVSAPGTNCYTGACTTGGDVARWDSYEWRLRVRDTLPSPRVRICMDNDPFDAAGLPKWECSNTGNVAILKLSWNRLNTLGATEFTSSADTLPVLVLPLTAGSSQ